MCVKKLLDDLHFRQFLIKVCSWPDRTTVCFVCTGVMSLNDLAIFI